MLHSHFEANPDYVSCLTTTKKKILLIFFFYIQAPSRAHGCSKLSAAADHLGISAIWEEPDTWHYFSFDFAGSVTQASDPQLWLYH